MINPRSKISDLARRRSIHVVLFMMAMLSLQSLDARAAMLVPDEYRAGTVTGKFDDTRQFAAVYRLRPPHRLRAQYLELAVGAITTPSETRGFASLGPVWHLPLHGDRVSIKFGFSPTLLGGSTFNGRDMGGNFHFTSSIAVEMTFGLRRVMSIALRIQHTSNGGISSTNPGMDMLGVNFNYSPGN